MTKRFASFLPLAVFAVLALLMAAPLLRGHDPSRLESAMIGKPAPLASIEGLAPGNLAQPVVLVNFFASWCLSCQAEQDVLARLSAENGVPLYGVAYKDRRGDTAAWLEKHGNPFSAVGYDDAGRAAIDWGVYGVPETYILAGGIIRYRHAGPVTPEVYEEILRPVLKEYLP